jgi:beta-galactosidase
VLPLDLTALPEPVAASTVDDPVAGPVLLRASFEIEASADLFLDTGEWGKGLAWLNGFPLGRYWRRGPQRTLYVPSPVVRAGANELVVLELDTMLDPAARFVPRPLLGHTEA